MAIGNPITDGTQVAANAVGFIRMFDLSVQNAISITEAQVEDVTAVALSPVTTPVAVNTLFGYMNATPASGNFAFAVDGFMAFVWFRLATYDNDATTRIAFWYDRDPFEYSSDSDLYDHYQESEQLGTLLALKNALIFTGETVSKSLNDAIDKEQKVLNLVES